MPAEHGGPWRQFLGSEHPPGNPHRPQRPSSCRPAPLMTPIDVIFDTCVFGAFEKAKSPRNGGIGSWTKVRRGERPVPLLSAQSKTEFQHDCRGRAAKSVASMNNESIVRSPVTRLDGLTKGARVAFTMDSDKQMSARFSFYCGETEPTNCSALCPAFT